jgi:hypothetical protein
MVRLAKVVLIDRNFYNFSGIESCPMVDSMLTDSLYLNFLGCLVYKLYSVVEYFT